MKRMIAAALISIALSAGLSARAQVRSNAQLIQVEGQASSVQYYCTVNGVVYPVDFSNNIWAINPATGLWFIIGHLYSTPNGFVAVNYLNVQYPAFCQ